MTERELYKLKLENRVAKLEASKKNEKCPGVLKKLKRKLANS